MPASKGVLRPEQMVRHVRFDETDPTPGAARWVERVWSVVWDLADGVEHVSSILPHPSVSLTVERGDVQRDGAPGPGVWVTGVVTHRFDAVCRGRGGVVGVKFHVGGFTALTGVSAVDLTDRTLPAAGLVAEATALSDLPLDARQAAPALCAFVEGLGRIREARGPDPGYELVTQAVGHLRDASVTRVDELADRCDLSVRSLQRLLRQYVGVGPKWMVARRRLHDAVAALDDGFDGSLADLAAHAGWYDQNQFARDFAALVGVTPGAYRDRSAPN